MKRLTLFFVAIVCFGMFGCSRPDVPNMNAAVTDQKGAKTEKAGETTTQTPINARPDFSVDSDTILKECIDNPKAADAKYKDKSVEVTGTVERLINGVSAFIMSTKIPKADNPKPTILRITVTKPNESVVGRLSIGQKVKAAGIFSRNALLDSVVDIYDCRVEELEPSSLQVFSSSSLANEFESDKAKTLAKYHEKELIIAGKFKRAWRSKKGPQEYVQLGGSGKNDLIIQIGFGGFSPLESIPNDHVVEIRAMCYRFRETDRDDSGNEYFFSFGYLVPKK